VSKLLKIAVLVLLGTSGAVAQVPGGNIFFGYSYEHARIPGPALLPDQGGIATSGSFGLNGWNASAEMKFLPLIGLVADFSGHYGSQTATTVCGNVSRCVPTQAKMDNTVYHFLIGPQLSFTVGRVRPFAHALFGAGHVSESTSLAPSSVTETDFAYALGGGVDYKLFGPLRWRVQGDLLRDQFFGPTQNNFRFSTGPVLHF